MLSLLVYFYEEVFGIEKLLYFFRELLDILIFRYSNILSCEEVRKF